jgi:hypothetical protein
MMVNGGEIVGENWKKTSRCSKREVGIGKMPISPFMVHPSTEPGGEGTVERVTANGQV